MTSRPALQTPDELKALGLLSSLGSLTVHLCAISRLVRRPDLGNLGAARSGITAMGPGVGSLRWKAEVLGSLEEMFEG